MRFLFTSVLAMFWASTGLAADKERIATIIEETCSHCHGVNGESSSSIYSRLAGQHVRYLVSQLKAFHGRKRTNDNAVMHTIVKKLTELELQAVALYVSGLKLQ